ncbi:hypothetical protein [Nonomuraea sp. NPDC049625]|uniref:hypothetical protein n=1 Tax=Nonomuraea sp. NPDC049625 TaxID=3155775 RepID=UPI00344699C8
MRTLTVLPGTLIAGLLLAGCAPAAKGLLSAPASTSGTPSAAATTSASPASFTHTPDPEEFSLRVKTLEKKCYGSVGCNVTYSIRVSYSGPALNPDQEYQVTYEVTGLEDGPAVNTFTIQGDEVSYQEEEFASTTSSSRTLKAKATEVERLGL